MQHYRLFRGVSVLLAATFLSACGDDEKSDPAPFKEHTVSLHYVGQNLQMTGTSQGTNMPGYVQGFVNPGNSAPATVDVKVNSPVSNVTSIDQTVPVGKLKETDAFRCVLGINLTQQDAKALTRSDMRWRVEVLVDGVERTRLVLDNAALQSTPATARLQYDIAANAW